MASQRHRKACIGAGAGGDVDRARAAGRGPNCRSRVRRPSWTRLATNFCRHFSSPKLASRVQFRNSEDVLHNVRVSNAVRHRNPCSTWRRLLSARYEHKFEPGYYNVTCDIHSTMRASILVTASPYTATTADDGSFSLSDVWPGQYNLTIYAGAAPVVRPVEMKAGGRILGSYSNESQNRRIRKNVSRVKAFSFRF